MPPSPRKCLAVASTLVLRARWSSPCRPLMTVSIFCTSAGILAVGLVGAAPPVVTGHAHARREGPRDAGRARLGRRDPSLLVGQRRVVGGADPDVVREERRAGEVVVAVHGVDAVDHRDLQRCCERLPLVPVDHVGPCLRRVRRRHRAAAGQQRAEPVLGDVGAVADRGALGLRHLPDLVGQRHPLIRSCTRVRDRQRAVEVRQPVRVDDHDRRRAGQRGAGRGERHRDRLRRRRGRAGQRVHVDRPGRAGLRCRPGTAACPSRR